MRIFQFVVIGGIAAALLTGCRVQVGPASFSTPGGGKWVTNEGDGRLILMPDNAARTSGRWRLDVKSWKGRSGSGVPIELVEGDNRSRSWFFQNIQNALDLTNLPERNGPAAAAVRTDAGTIELQGFVENGKATGDYRFAPDAAFAAEATKLLGAPLTDAQMFEFVLSDVSLPYMRAMHELGLAKSSQDVLSLRRSGITPENAKEYVALGLKREEITKLRAHGAQPAFVREVREQGYGKNVDEILKFRSHGVTAALLKEWNGAGFTPSADEVIKLRSHGLQPSYAAGWKKAGFNFNYDELIRARAHGVPVEFAAAVQKSGSAPTLEELIRLRQFGVTPDYFSAVKQSNSEYGIEEMVRFRQHGITPEWLEGVKKAGYTFNRDDLVKLKQYGVQPEYLAALQAPGRKPLDVAAILELRNRGVTAETARKLRE